MGGGSQGCEKLLEEVSWSLVTNKYPEVSIPNSYRGCVLETRMLGLRVEYGGPGVLPEVKENTSEPFRILS